MLESTEIAPYVPPMAPYVWEVRTELRNDVLVTPRIALDFRRPVEVLAVTNFVSRVRPLIGGALEFPSAFDIEVMLDIDQQERLTNRLDEIGGLGPGESFVSLEHMSPNLRLLRARLTAGAPQIGVQFRWKQFLVGTPFFEHALISLVFYCRELD